MAVHTALPARSTLLHRLLPRGLAVVIAADRPEDVEVMTLTLEALGCDVAAAPVGPAAVELTQLAQPDAVVVIAGADGWEALPSAIADRAGWRKPLVVALTRPGDGRPAPDGVHLALDRPVSADALAALVRRFRELLAGIDGFDPSI